MPRTGRKGQGRPDALRKPVRELRTPDHPHCVRCGLRVHDVNTIWELPATGARVCKGCYQQAMIGLAGIAGREAEVNARYLRQYGITLRRYGEMYAAQRGLCAICGDRGEPTTADRRTLAVDHDHETGAVRGLLCGRCNTALGLLGDDPEVIVAAAEYLRSHRGEGAA